MWRTTMKAVNFYEVMDRKGDIAWGGASASEAVEWYRRNIDSSIFVSVWDEQDEEEPVLVTDKIEVSSLVLSAISNEKERAW
jgi:hypothetical protein